MKLIPIFKPGRHLASNGTAYEFTEAMLVASAAAYDPSKHEAPLVVGHPKADGPSYGWVQSLAFAAPELNAVPRQVEPQFAELYVSGRFKKVSASFYTPDSPDNPVPGVYYLRHVGFLGAQPPAVKGLKSASFAAAEKGVIEFVEWNDLTVASMFRRIKNYFIEQSGQEKADAVLPEYELENLQVSAAQKTAASSPAYAERTRKEKQMQLTQEQLDAKEEELNKRAAEQAAKDTEFAERETKAKAADDAQRKLAAEQAVKDTEFAERETKAKAADAQQRRGVIAGQVDALIAAGKVLPKDKAALVAFMESVGADATIEFGEGDQKATKPAAGWLAEFLEHLPKAIDYSEHGHKGVIAADSDSAEVIAKAAVEFQEAETKAGREISVTAAVQHVTKIGK